MGRYTHLDVGVIILTVPMHMVLSTKVYRWTWEGITIPIADHQEVNPHDVEIDMRSTTASMAARSHHTNMVVCTPACANTSK